MLQRPERVVLLSAPQAFFGLALHGLVLMAIIVLLAVTAWITAVQRIVAVYTRPRGCDHPNAALSRSDGEAPRVRSAEPIAARSMSKGE